MQEEHKSQRQRSLRRRSPRQPRRPPRAKEARNQKSLAAIAAPAAAVAARCKSLPEIFSENLSKKIRKISKIYLISFILKQDRVGITTNLEG